MPDDRGQRREVGRRNAEVGIIRFRIDMGAHAIPSTFDIQYSIFAFSQILFRLNWPLFRPAAGLTPDTRNLKPCTVYLPPQSSRNQYPATRIQYQASSIEHPAPLFKRFFSYKFAVRRKLLQYNFVVIRRLSSDHAGHLFGDAWCQHQTLAAHAAGM